jgi:outer membrane protein
MEMPTMKTRSLAIGCLAALAVASLAAPASGEDLLQIYREGLVSDPTLAAARATWVATQEALPQARSGLLPVVSLLGNANEQNYYNRLHTNPGVAVTQQFPFYGYTVTASQPLYRPQNWITFDQAKVQVNQADYTLASAQQDLIVRVAQAYFDVLLAQFTIELIESQKAAVSENLALAKRNFEVGVATITDTNDAQAKYDQIVAQEVSVQNDLANRMAALRAIIGRTPNSLVRVDTSYEPQLPSPLAIEPWMDRQRAAHYPTVDLVASFNQNYSGGAATTNISGNFYQDARLGIIGLQLNMPLYQGGLVNSRVRQAIANVDASRQNLESARRSAQLLAQTSYAGVTSGVAQVKALGQALKSAQVSYESNKLGLEVGVRTNLDVLNQQQQVFQTRFNIAQAYYNYIISALKLKQSVGTLSDEDVEKINRDLGG